MLFVLQKAKKGEQVAGHKYQSRKPDGKGGWIYDYGKKGRAPAAAPEVNRAPVTLVRRDEYKFERLLIEDLPLRSVEQSDHAMSVIVKQMLCSAIGSRLARNGIDRAALDAWAEWMGEPYLADTNDYEALGEFVRRAIHSWAESSSDHFVMSVALQLAAVEEFGLDRAVTSHFNRGTVSKAENAPTEVANLLRRFLRAQYDETQAMLRRHGITEITLYRGWANDGSVKDRGLDHQRRSVQLQPVSSFSSDVGTAIFFATDKTSGTDPWSSVVMGMRVPADRILSTARSGFGCFREYEATVLGGVYETFMINAQALDYDPDEFFKLADRAGAIEADY